MSRERIRVTEIEAGLIEIDRSGHVEKIKKNIDEARYCQMVDAFFHREQMQALPSEEQIIARGYLAWSYFWPQTIYQELFAKYPLERFDYKCDPETDLARYLTWSQDKYAWNPIHWLIYFFCYLPFLRLRLSSFVGPLLVGLSIDDERWKNFTALPSLKMGGGKWRMNSWLNSLPLLHPRKFSLVGDVTQKVLAHVKNMQLSAKFLQVALPRRQGEMHFWDDFNYTYPLRLAALSKCNRVIIHQHAPSFTNIHVTGQIISQYKMMGLAEWSCWDKEWAALASEMNTDLKVSITESNLPYSEVIPFRKDGMVIFPWESFCDNNLKNSAILHAIECGLPVAIKLRPGYSKDLQLKSFGLLPEKELTIVTDWGQLERGVRAIVGGQTALVYQGYRQNIPTLVMSYASQTYKSWLDKKLPSNNLINCQSEESLFLALQALVRKDYEHE
jgi:hypothetical protein